MSSHPPLSVLEAADLFTMLSLIHAQDWNAAHEIAQSQEGVWAYDRLHAYLHLLEGDQWNAGYWYRRCGITPSQVSDKEEWQYLSRWVAPYHLTEKIVYHVVNSSDWESQTHSTTYFSPTFSTEGFIHLCTETQVAGVLERYFAGKNNLLLLSLEVESIKAHLKMEPGPTGDYFPHLYAGIPQNAIQAVKKLN